MNEIDQIDWDQITDAHGNDVGFLPKYLKDITADDSKTWVQALEVLGDTLEYSGISDATVAALPFIITPCKDRTTVALPRIIELLGRIARRCRTFKLPKPAPGNGVSETEYETVCQAIARTRCLLFDSLQIFCELLSSENSAVRCSAPYPLGMLLADGDDDSFAERDWRTVAKNVSDSLTHLAATEPIPLVRASALQALGHLGRVQPANISVLVNYATCEFPPAVRGAAAIGVVEAGVSAPPMSVAAVLSEILTTPEKFKKAYSSASYAAEWQDSSLGAIYSKLGYEAEPEDIDSSAADMRFIWFRSPLFEAVWAVCRLAPEMADAVLPALITMVEHETGDDFHFSRVTGPILEYVFAGVQAKNLSPLTHSQRRILLAFYNNRALWNSGGLVPSSTLFQVGLPKAEDKFRPLWRELIGHSDADGPRRDSPGT